MCPPFSSTTHCRRRLHSPMLWSMKRCGSACHSIVCFNWSTSRPTNSLRINILVKVGIKRQQSRRHHATRCRWCGNKWCLLMTVNRGSVDALLLSHHTLVPDKYTRILLTCKNISHFDTHCCHMGTAIKLSVRVSGCQKLQQDAWCQMVNIWMNFVKFELKKLLL